MTNNEIRMIDLVNKIRCNRNVSKKNIMRVIKALPKVFKRILLDRKEVVFENFVKLGFRNAKDRNIKSRLTGETLHMPAHLRFKATFSTEAKKYLNE